MVRLLAALLLIFSSSYAAPKVRPHNTAHRSIPKKPPAPPPPTFDADAVNNPATTDPVGPKDAGSAVLRAQILLDRAHFSVGEIDGTYGGNMWNTVKAYQAAHNLPPDGVVTPDTWKTLDGDTQPALATYVIADADVAGPFYKIPTDMLEQAKLPALGYTSAVEELGERFHVSPKLLKDLNTGKQLDKAGEQILVPNVGRAALTGQAALVVVKQACSCVEVFDVANQLLAHYPATMGSEHDPLPVGEWKLSKPLMNPEFHYNSDLFWDANEKNAKATIKPGPNNPVGVAWSGLSKEHYGIHGTPEPANIGKTQSHGCIRLTNWDAWELANMVQPGMPASLREG
jgi:lipoprotein-anchoring transpeptidase ErfK/SrfK